MVQLQARESELNRRLAELENEYLLMGREVSQRQAAQEVEEARLQELIRSLSGGPAQPEIKLEALLKITIDAARLVDLEKRAALSEQLAALIRETYILIGQGRIESSERHLAKLRERNRVQNDSSGNRGNDNYCCYGKPYRRCLCTHSKIILISNSKR